MSLNRVAGEKVGFTASVWSQSFTCREWKRHALYVFEEKMSSFGEVNKLLSFIES